MGNEVHYATHVLLGLTLAGCHDTTPGAVGGAGAYSRAVGLHAVSRSTQECDVLTNSKVLSIPHPIGWNPRVATIYHCDGKKESEKEKEN